MRHSTSPRALPVALSLLLLLTGLAPLRAQLAVTGGLTPTDLAESLVGGGVTISGVSMTCPTGAFGRFDATAANLPIDSGIILASGAITNAVGPNNAPGAGSDLFAPGDADLDALVTGGTNDACVLEFDVEVTTDTLVFTYVFASEEYLEFVGSTFNDVFAFWISGPGYATPTNIARIPGTALPVAINTVNDLSFPAYYVNNGDGFSAPFSVDPAYVQYDGHTVALEAMAVVQPCETYHLKLAVADVADGILDSGVFIEAGSLTGRGVTLSSKTSVGFGFDNAIEGCVDGIFVFEPITVPVDTTVVHFGIGGTATNGVDYLPIADSIVFLPGDTAVELVITPLIDPIPEGLENVVIYLLDPCFGLPYDSASIDIQDRIELAATATPDVTLCPGDTVFLQATGGLDYLWTSGPGLSADSVADPFALPPAGGATYTVYTMLGTCDDSVSLFVDVSSGPTAEAGPPVDLCEGGAVTLGATGGATYTWVPATGLDNPSVPNPTTTIGADITYVVTVADGAGCTDADSVRVTVRPNPSAEAVPAEATVCPGEPVALTASGGTAYAWSPTAGLDDPAGADPVATVTASVTYTVTVANAFGCTDEATVVLNVDPLPTVDAGPDQTIDFGQSAQLGGSSSSADFLWSPAASLSDPKVLTPVATPDITTWYVLTAYSPAGCPAADSLRVLVIEPPSVVIPNAFTPDGDGLNDVLRPVQLLDLAGRVSFRVFNRWGETVFESADLSAGWDGTWMGKAQEMGTYLYIFTATDRRGDPYTLTGTVTLIR
jgi:gliding motility-associated-like protein